jgi:Family of unknown function (DUF5670)
MSLIWTLIVVLLILWICGFAVNIGGGLIHLLLVIILILVIIDLINGRRIL